MKSPRAPRSKKKSPRSDVLKIAITTGDVDGIGFEVSCKAIREFFSKSATHEYDGLQLIVLNYCMI